jgi:hypothetical protein
MARYRQGAGCRKRGCTWYQASCVTHAIHVHAGEELDCSRPASGPDSALGLERQRPNGTMRWGHWHAAACSRVLALNERWVVLLLQRIAACLLVEAT